MYNDQTTGKKQYSVYHAKNPLKNILVPSTEDWFPGVEETDTFRCVADLWAQSPEEVFVLTNNHGAGPCWTSNPAVWYRLSHPELLEKTIDEELRSTSVGEIIQETHTSHAWLILPDGFEELSRVFGAKGDEVLILCDRRTDWEQEQRYVLRFFPEDRAKDCWQALLDAGLFPGLLAADYGEISFFQDDFQDDTEDLRRLKRIATQYAAGERHFTFPWMRKHYEGEVDDGEDGEEDTFEDEEEVEEPLPCGWGHSLRTWFGRIVRAFLPLKTS